MAKANGTNDYARRLRHGLNIAFRGLLMLGYFLVIYLELGK